MVDTRPVRLCDSCGGVDDHPRHVYVTSPGDSPTSSEVAAKALEGQTGTALVSLLDQIRDESTTVKHMDCCRTDGCPDQTCNQVTLGAEALRGPKLLKHLTKEA